jgi:enamine deaminase RidA (YjgF/YER057c/UK114 family)
VGYADGKVGETFEEQADIAHANVIRELAAAGATAKDVLKLNTYVVDLDSSRSKAVQAAKSKYFNHENQPASTMVGVSALVMKPLLVEVEATAVIEV